MADMDTLEDRCLKKDERGTPPNAAEWAIYRKNLKQEKEEQRRELEMSLLYPRCVTSV